MACSGIKELDIVSFIDISMLTLWCVMLQVLRVQVILLEEAWSELFLLCAIQWSMPMETSPLLMTHDAAQPQMPNIKTGSEYPDNRMLQEIFRRFKHTQVDPAEFACLKAIALFKPGM